MENGCLKTISRDYNVNRKRYNFLKGKYHVRVIIFMHYANY